MSDQIPLEDQPLENIDFHVRTWHGLMKMFQREKELGRRSGPVLVRHLLALTPNDLLNIRNFGKGALADVQQRLAERGLALRPNRSELERLRETLADVEAERDDFRRAYTYANDLLHAARDHIAKLECQLAQRDA